MPFAPFARILQAIRADSEDGTEFDGYVSTRAEWHAVAFGFSTAFVAAFVGEPMFFVIALAWVINRGRKGGVRRELLKEIVYVVAHAIPGFVLGSGAAVIYHNLLTAVPV